jgi:hypothetical protein
VVATGILASHAALVAGCKVANVAPLQNTQHDITPQHSIGKPKACRPAG